mgnify:CR=1 FL=1
MYILIPSFTERPKSKTPIKFKLLTHGDEKQIDTEIKALQKMNGKLFPFGFWHLLNAKKHAKTVTFYLIGVLPEYQNKGVAAIIFREMHSVFTKRGIKYIETNPELEENNWVDLSFLISKIPFGRFTPSK